MSDQATAATNEKRPDPAYDAFAASVVVGLKTKAVDRDSAAALLKAATGFSSLHTAFNAGAAVETLLAQIANTSWPPAEPPHQREQERPPSGQQGGRQLKPTPLAEVRQQHTKWIKSKKTGTVSPFLDAEGRLLLFRHDHPTFVLRSELISMTDQGILFRCEVLDEQDRLLSTGHGFATWSGADAPPEKAETAAVARALRHFGVLDDWIAE